MYLAVWSVYDFCWLCHWRVKRERDYTAWNGFTRIRTAAGWTVAVQIRLFSADGDHPRQSCEAAGVGIGGTFWARLAEIHQSIVAREMEKSTYVSDQPFSENVAKATEKSKPKSPRSSGLHIFESG